jgi:DNA polymerase-4
MTVIAVSKEAKRFGVKNVMRVPDVLALCPDIILVPQRPDLIRRAHLTLLSEIESEIPIDVVKSIDELACVLDQNTIADPRGLSERIKDRLRKNVGEHITCSIGIAANRLLAKIACKVDKPNGTTIWHPKDMPGPLVLRPLSDIPGVGDRIAARLAGLNINTIEALLGTRPAQLRAIWGNVNGERMWYALHGHAIQAEPTQRSMFGHGRVLPPEWRNIESARDCSRLLLVKAARRMRRDGFAARQLSLWLNGFKDGWGGAMPLQNVHDDQACLTALHLLWVRAEKALSPKFAIIRCGVMLEDLTPIGIRQLSLFEEDDQDRQKWERVQGIMDDLNFSHGKRVLTLGSWTPPPGGFAGGKIAFTRIPDSEDFL